MALGEAARTRLAIVLETMLGEEAPIARDVAAYFDQYLASVPPLTRFGLRLMVWALLWLPLVFVGRPTVASDLPVALRERYMDKWVHSGNYYIREGFFLVKTVALLGWGAHPTVRARFGMPPVAAVIPAPAAP
jgi:hypothetical protein